jgi:hypothetical protein
LHDEFVQHHAEEQLSGIEGQQITQLLTPVAGLWVVHNAMIVSAKFVNNMRETIATGYYEDRILSVDHKRAMLIDWTLSMGGLVATCFLFSGILLSACVWVPMEPFLKWSIIAIGVYPILGALLFGVCAVWDYKLMRKKINETPRHNDEGRSAMAGARPELEAEECDTPVQDG